MNKQSKIYIAGHTGLVGTAICKSFERNGYHNLMGKTIHELDLRNQNETYNFFKKEKPDYVILAAAKVGGIHANNKYRADFIYENLMIQNNVIFNAWKFGVKKLLFLGSTCIYPKETSQPMAEKQLLTSPLEYTNEPYAIAKIAGIKMCESFNIQYGTNFISVMPTNLYGPNDNFDLENSHVLPALIRKFSLAKNLEDNNWDAILSDIKKRPIKSIKSYNSEEIIATFSKIGIKKKSVEIWGTGKPLREFLWSEDMAEACLFVMEKVNFKDVISSKKKIRNTHINIGTGQEIAIKNLANNIKKEVSYNGEIIFNASKPDGTLRKLTNPNKIHMLGWKHKIDLEEGISKLHKWYLKSIYD